MADGLNFERVVAQYYEPLYQFAFSLTRSEAEACDLTQQTFYVWATKGHQLREVAKVKTWLFTTLLEVPMGTVKSRISRGIGQLQKLMAKDIAAGEQT